MDNNITNINSLENLNIIKKYVSTDITSQELIHVFNILLKKKMITPQEYGRAINKIKDTYNTIPNNNI